MCFDNFICFRSKEGLFRQQSLPQQESQVRSVVLRVIQRSWRPLRLPSTQSWRVNAEELKTSEGITGEQMLWREGASVSSDGRLSSGARQCSSLVLAPPFVARSCAGGAGNRDATQPCFHSLLILRSPFEFYGLGNSKHMIYYYSRISEDLETLYQ